MSVTPRIPRTISRIGYAMITATNQSTGKDTYGAVKLLPHIAGGREFSAEPQGDTFSIFADGLEVYAENNNAGYEISLTTVAVTDDVEADWYGNTIVADGVAEYANRNQAPEFALFILEETTDGIGKVHFFGKCHVTTRPTKAGKTKEEGAIDPQFPQHNISARPRLDCFAVKATIHGKTKLNAVPTPTKAGNHVNILQEAVSVPVGGTVKLTINDKYPADASVSWTSGTQGKATVSSDGTVTGVATGSSVITATITVGGTDYTDTCTVTVVSAS